MSFILNPLNSVIPIGGIATLTGNSGGAVGPTVGNVNIVGSSGVSVVGNPGTSTLTISVTGAGFTWNEVTLTSASMAVENGYIANNVGLVTLTLPATAALGDSIKVVGKGSGKWKIAQNVGQTIHFDSSPTTAGVTGYLQATAQYDCLELLCITANTTWVIVSSVGTITVA